MASHGVKMSACIPKPNNVQADDFSALQMYSGSVGVPGVPTILYRTSSVEDRL